MLVIGLTGGIASGKSTVSSIIREFGFTVVCADELAHKVIERDSAGYHKVIKLFGSGILDDSGVINRSKLGSVVFDDHDARKQLESIIHPLVREAIDEQIQFAKQRGESVIFIDVPLLFEAGLAGRFDRIILVYTPAEIQKIRLKKRDGIAENEIEQRVGAQLPIDEKLRLSNIVIDNSGGLEATRKQIATVLTDLRVLASTY